MNSCELVIGSAALMLAGAAVWPREVDPPAPPQELARAERIDDLLESIRAKHEIPALAAVCVRGGEIIAIAAAGTRKAGAEAPLTIDDLFHIGSCTKAMTATLAGILVEDENITWETTIEDAFSELAERIRPEYRRATLAQLLQHRAGLPDDRNPDPRIWPRIVALQGPLREQRTALVEIALNQAPAAPPGQKTIYSNFGYVIAGAMLERAADSSWEDLIRGRLFEPLGMTSAGFGAPGADDPAAGDSITQPWGHAARGESVRPIAPGPRADNPAVIRPAGGVHCTLGDWAMFAALHLGAHRDDDDDDRAPFLTNEMLATLHHAPEGSQHGMGWVVVERGWANGAALTHAGSNRMWFALVWLAPERDAGFLAASNCGSEAALTACDEAIAAMIGKYLADK